MHAIVAANAEFYSANLAAEARKGLIQKAKTGGTPTRAPIGYLNVRKMIDGHEIRTVEIDPDRAPHIQWAFTAYATGAYTLDTLGDALTDRDLPPAPPRADPAKPLSRSQLAALLVNPYYIGIVRYAASNTTATTPPLITDAPSSEPAPSSTPRTRRGARPQARPLPQGHPLLRTLHSRMSLTHAKGNGGTYPYFFCIGRTRRNGCQQPYIPTNTIEHAVERTYTPTSHQPPPHRNHPHQARPRLAGMRQHAEQEIKPASNAASPNSPTSAPSSYTPTTTTRSPSTSSTTSRSASAGQTANAEAQLAPRSAPPTDVRAPRQGARPPRRQPPPPTPTHPPTCAANGTRRIPAPPRPRPRHPTRRDRRALRHTHDTKPRRQTRQPTRHARRKG